MRHRVISRILFSLNKDVVTWRDVKKDEWNLGNEWRRDLFLLFLLSVTASRGEHVSLPRRKTAIKTAATIISSAAILRKAIDASGADKGRTGCTIPSCLEIRRPTMGLNVFRFPLPPFLSFSLSVPLLTLDIRWKTVSSTRRYAQYAEMLCDPEDHHRGCLYLCPCSLNGNDRERCCDNSSRIIASARNRRLALRVKSTRWI